MTSIARNPFNTQDAFMSSLHVVAEASDSDSSVEDIATKSLQTIEEWVSDTVSTGCCSKCCLQQRFDDLKIHRERWIPMTKQQRQIRAQTILYCCRKANRSNLNGREVLVYSFYPFQAVCIKAFSILVGFSHRTLKRWLKHFKNNGLTTILHGNTNKLPSHAFTSAEKESVKNWILSFAKQEGEERPGRFGQGRLRDVLFTLPPQYTLKSIYLVYINDEGRPLTQIGYESFRLLFHALPLKIESPKSDVCDECTEYKLKISACNDDAELQRLNAIFNNHLTQARYAREEYHVDSRIEEFMHISFDYAQNLWLPHLANQPSCFYFASLLNVCLFGILDEKTNKQMNYIYSEEHGKKGSNNVVSMLTDYFFCIRPEKRRKIIFHCDNCTGQNKNNCMVKMLCWLVQMDHADEIYLKFMVRGHTKFGPDGHFAMIKKQFQNKDCYLVEHIENVINNSSEFNFAKQFPSKRFSSYREPLDGLYHDINGISQQQCFWFSKDWVGTVKMRKSFEQEFTSFRMTIDEQDNFQFNPSTLVVPGLKLIKQREMYSKVRPFVPDRYKDVLCPSPSVPLEPVIITAETQLVAVSNPPKTRRTATADELAKLTAVFNVNPRPNKAIVENLAFELVWEVKRVKAWFANRKRV